MPPQATNKRVPSGKIASAVGARPATCCRKGWRAIVCTTLLRGAALGMRIFPAFRRLLGEPIIQTPWLRQAAGALVVVTGAVTALTVLNLAWRGLAPVHRETHQPPGHRLDVQLDQEPDGAVHCVLVRVDGPGTRLGLVPGVAGNQRFARLDLLRQVLRGARTGTAVRPWVCRVPAEDADISAQKTSVAGRAGQQLGACPSISEDQGNRSSAGST